jgi:hypothetical protein
MCVADSSSSRHFSQVGSSVKPSLKRCPFRWQCPVNSLTTHLNWSLFNSNRYFVLLAEGLSISPFACLSPVTDSQCILWLLFIQSPTTFLATPVEMPQLVQVLWTNVQIPFLPADLPFHYQQYPHDLPPISVELWYVWPVLGGTDGSPKPVLRWSGICQVL